MNDTEIPRWMQRDNDWDAALVNRHLDLESATEVQAVRRRAQQESRKLRPRRVSGLHAESEVFIPASGRPRVPPPEQQENELA